jgi:hypothetical protein
MTDLKGGVFGGADGHDRDANLFLPGKEVAHAAVRGVENAFADFFGTERNFDLELAIANNELSGGRQVDGEGIVGEDGYDIVAAGQAK